ncbi:MAG TPA: hypothetical protein VHA11_10990, partial [Bryobacteraceae bacterium]|nr:hypothetical protein [Bryobacteraceae bacterium]
MNALVLLVGLLFGAALALVTLVQLLYMESLRLRPRERPLLEYFKETLQARIGVDTEHGLLTFSLLKHTLLVLLGAACLIAAFGGRAGAPARADIESTALAWLVMLGATYVIPHVLYR